MLESLTRDDKFAALALAAVGLGSGVLVLLACAIWGGDLSLDQLLGR